ncbi:MAG: hypothetical protein ACP5M4_01495 [Acidobacteriaceae bacterium]
MALQAASAAGIVIKCQESLAAGSGIGWIEANSTALLKASSMLALAVKSLILFTKAKLLLPIGHLE